VAVSDPFIAQKKETALATRGRSPSNQASLHRNGERVVRLVVIRQTVDDTTDDVSLPHHLLLFTVRSTKNALALRSILRSAACAER
jgi:hypothetical protein